MTLRAGVGAVLAKQAPPARECGDHFYSPESCKSRWQGIPCQHPPAMNRCINQGKGDMRGNCDANDRKQNVSFPLTGFCLGFLMSSLIWPGTRRRLTPFRLWPPPGGKDRAQHGPSDELLRALEGLDARRARRRP